MSLDTETTELTDERILQQLANRLRLCQHETDPLTETELAAITRYTRDIEGIPETLDSLDADCIRAFGEHHLDVMRSNFRLLGEWGERITSLKEDLPRNGDGAFSTAAANFIGYELMEAETAARGIHAAVAEYFLGKDEYGYPYGDLRPCEGSRYVDGMFWVQPSV